jgi:hypothetical protein
VYLRAYAVRLTVCLFVVCMCVLAYVSELVVSLSLALCVRVGVWDGGSGQDV